eukprot:763448-Hanusia_phi.AAC.6
MEDLHRWGHHDSPDTVSWRSRGHELSVLRRQVVDDVLKKAWEGVVSFVFRSPAGFSHRRCSLAACSCKVEGNPDKLTVGS